MEDQNYLLTYEYTEEDRKTRITYSWFEDEEELIEFIEHSKKNLFEFKVTEAMKIRDCTNIEIS